MIKKIPQSEILVVWAKKLWPGRQEIKSHSAMCFLKGHDMRNTKYDATFFGYYVDSVLVGVNSGHGTVTGYRSRGLWVDEQYRGQGIGKKLLLATIEQGQQEGFDMVWSLPRQTSWPTYASAGFVLASDWHATDTSDSNAYCQKSLTTIK
jgi:GNAT superfamily N-acetyltransferase